MAADPLNDLKVIEYAEMVSGPMCGKLFADLGANVIKVEPPEGDEARRHPPFANDTPHPEKSGFFLYLNTSKKGVTLNLHDATGVAIFKELIRDADVLIENNPPGLMASLGLGWEELSAINPRLIMTSVTNFGQTGPYRDWKGSDLITWAMSLTGLNTPTMVDDPEKENPLRAPGHEADMVGATTAAATAMFAIAHREMTGQGQWLDVPIWQSLVNTAKSEMTSYTYLDRPFSRLRSAAAGGLEPSPCKDGYVWLLWFMQPHFEALKDMLGHPEDLESELFKDMVGRRDYADALRAIVWREFAKYDMDYLVAEGQKRTLPIGPVYTVARATTDAHLAARKAFVEIDHPMTGPVRYPRALVRFDSTEIVPTRAPLLGEHNEEIFGKLGYSKETLSALRAAGII